MSETEMFGDDLDYLERMYQRHSGPEPTGHLAVDANVVEEFWRLFSQNGGNSAPGWAIAEESAKAIVRAERGYRPPLDDEVEEYKAAWGEHRRIALAIAAELKPIGGEAERIAVEFEFQSGSPHDQQSALPVFRRSDAIPVLAYVRRRRVRYTQIEELGAEEPQTFAHVLALVQLGMQACDRLQDALQRMSGAEKIST
ncbi:MAG TPA: hypothetical protein V6C81_11980 [Planktothrix sp.]|jgi:hypothetical protein